MGAFLITLQQECCAYNNDRELEFRKQVMLKNTPIDGLDKEGKVSLGKMFLRFEYKQIRE